ncbi:glycosyltransferase family 4 protein [Marinovum sp. 2_MG-2023]|uniref:glycosyltransferase family 4 protein n=1 Tax=unclassified Marinovum TaxID=2647166 RepID=UPI0026E35A72|nr:MULTISPECIES: glycosyltransferase family 4 protein [unclassified Marinovum]MDO6730170.1 glycosyltransferase family 4 protein [Marinovum sp. 2_MG-2023]MDO6778908.1 glycosyltransferase family 4 protein [Marinovum sp. 1_MG-2023]
MPSRRKIAYLCDLSPHDPLTYSGGNARIFNALQEHVGDVTPLDPGWGRIDCLRRLILAMPKAVSIRLLWRVQLALSSLIAPAIQKQLARGRFDVLVGAYSFHSFAALKLPPGVFSVYTADATPTTYKRSVVGQSFDRYLRISRLLDPMIMRVERRVFRNLNLMIWPTEWLKSGADGLYELKPDRSIVVPWGGNVTDPVPSDVPPALSRGTQVRFVLVGRDWWAKGGPLVFETLVELRARGIDAVLDVIGATPPREHIADFVTVHGVLDKSLPNEMATFEAVMRRSHFLFQPSLESYGFAFCEASAYGLPSLCLRIGGVPVREGVNGHALPYGSGPEGFLNRIETYLENPKSYEALRRSARKEYEDRLNWDAWGRRVDAILAERGR